jgi:hypothetical protein
MASMTLSETPVALPRSRRGVVLAGDAGEEGDLLAAQARDPSAVAAVGGQPGLGGTDLGPSRAQELPDLTA